MSVASSAVLRLSMRACVRAGKNTVYHKIDGGEFGMANRTEMHVPRHVMRCLTATGLGPTRTVQLNYLSMRTFDACGARSRGN
jgi:hypothetical protein